MALLVMVPLFPRMKKFNLELHPEKTRLLEFGPFAINNRPRRGEGKPETFNFLGYVFPALMCWTPLKPPPERHGPL